MRARAECSGRHDGPRRKRRTDDTRVCFHMERTCECPKSLAGQEVRSAVWPSQTSDERRRHVGDFGHSRGMYFFSLGLPRERPLAALRSLRIRPVFAASRASRAAVLVATHVRSICKQTLGRMSTSRQRRKALRLARLRGPAGKRCAALSHGGARARLPLADTSHAAHELIAAPTRARNADAGTA